jgi:hypothetical protein
MKSLLSVDMRRLRSRKKVSFSFRSDLDAARQFLDGIVTDDSVYHLEVSWG